MIQVALPFCGKLETKTSLFISFLLGICFSGSFSSWSFQDAQCTRCRSHSLYSFILALSFPFCTPTSAHPNVEYNNTTYKFCVLNMKNYNFQCVHRVHTLNGELGFASENSSFGLTVLFYAFVYACVFHTKWTKLSKNWEKHTHKFICELRAIFGTYRTKHIGIGELMHVVRTVFVFEFCISFCLLLASGRRENVSVVFSLGYFLVT